MLETSEQQMQGVACKHCKGTGKCERYVEKTGRVASCKECVSDQGGPMEAFSFFLESIGLGGERKRVNHCFYCKGKGHVPFSKDALFMRRSCDKPPAQGGYCDKSEIA